MLKIGAIVNPEADTLQQAGLIVQRLESTLEMARGFFLEAYELSNAGELTSAKRGWYHEAIMNEIGVAVNQFDKIGDLLSTYDPVLWNEVDALIQNSLTVANVTAQIPIKDFQQNFLERWVANIDNYEQATVRLKAKIEEILNQMGKELAKLPMGAVTKGAGIIIGIAVVVGAGRIWYARKAAQK